MKAIKVLAFLFAQMIAVQSLCQVSIPVEPADATVTISFLPTYGNCGGLETPENSFVDPLGYVIVQCDTACAFTLSAAGGSVFLDQATTDCNFNIDGLPVPVYLPGEPDCHAGCVCEQDGDNEQTFNLLYDPSSDFIPNACGTPTMCAPLLPDYRCALGLGPSIVDTPTCGIDVDAQVLTTCSECSTGLPSPTNLYSVFLSLGDLNVGAYCTDIEGRAAVAGDANWCSAIGSQIAGPNTNNIPCMELIDYLCDYQWAFVVGGTANIDGAVYGGDAWASVYQTSNLGRVKNQTQEKTKPKINSLAQKLAGRSDAKDLEARINKQQKIEKPEAVDYQCLTFAPPTPVPIDFSAMEAKLKQYQFILNSQTPTGQVSFTGPTITFRGSNTVDTEVFAVNCASIGSATTGMKVENINPAVKAIIVNVFCYPNNWTIDSSSGFGMQAWEPFQNRLIWVVDSDGVNIASIGFRGTLLAPWAHVNANNGNIWGQLLAHSFTGSYQFNLPLWAGCPSIVYPPADKKDPKIRAPPPHRTVKANKA